ncbi:hypothetical protein IAG44_21095 [Streptomyces roseirectus]|uniref:Integral membrane protein n=1 Tax=Streptomyces roseirectus TaxID=2768066 RepID=A0A7H0IFW3_9ACTN|nr:hypothetical protein [Streptomyces roseirectus]QNP71679.1 hypothetical protein IAG44_21095 [Streptomyces roseirectus]
MSVPRPRAECAGRDLRLLRAAVFAAVCVVLAAAGHAVASCESVPLWTLGAGFLVMCAIAWPLCGRERSLPGIVALLAAGQTALHTVFGVGQHAQQPPPVTHDAALVEQAARLLCGTTAAAISPAHAYRILTEARVYDAGAHPAEQMSAGSAGLLPSLPMLLGHVLAAVAAGWLLRRGDSALLRLIGLSARGVAEGALMRSLRGALTLVRALLAGLPGAPGKGPRAPRADQLAPPRLRHTELQHAVVRRGPPAGAFALAA